MGFHVSLGGLYDVVGRCSWASSVSGDHWESSAEDSAEMCCCSQGPPVSGESIQFLVVVGGSSLNPFPCLAPNLNPKL